MNIRNPRGAERVPDADVIHRCPVMDCTDFRRHHLAYLDDTLPGDVLVAAERHRVECAACGAHDTLVRRSLLLARNLPSIEPSADFTARLDARLREVRAEGRADVKELAWAEARWNGAAWYERLVQDAGGWGRQAVGAAVVLAAVSAGYAMGGGRDGTREPATGAGAVAAPPPAASTLGARAADGGTVLGAAVVAAPAGIAAHAARRRDGTRATVDPSTVARDAEDLNPPAYIPLPAGAVEASALLGPASAGIPVWPAALLAGEAPFQLRAAGRGAPSLRVVGLSH